MDAIPARILHRAIAATPGHPPLSEKDRQRRAYIVAATREILIQHGRAALQMRSLAPALGVGAGTIRRLFFDLDALLGLILQQHLDVILAAVTASASRAGRRAAYFSATRGHGETLALLHAIFVRERFVLPPDILEPLETQRRMIGMLLAGEAWEEALALLDLPGASLERVEAGLAAMDPVRMPDAEDAQPVPLRAAQATKTAAPHRVVPPAAAPAAILPLSEPRVIAHPAMLLARFLDKPPEFAAAS